MFSLEKSLRCLMGHNFDKAKEGYVNLFIKNGSGKRHGDDKLMVNARKDFLNKGYYAPLRQKLGEILGEGNTVLDAGCGEGYYTSLFAEKNMVCGIDISKDALKYAAKNCKNSAFAVASIAEIPLADKSVDRVINIFAPESLKEFSRVLKKDGRFITVQPLENHLFELKEKVYNKPYKNPSPLLEKEGFELISTEKIKYEICLDNNEDIVNLFKMTPYYYKTSAKDQQKLQNLNTLTTTIEFFVAVYGKLDFFDI